MTAKSDDLEAVRVIAATLEPFKSDDRDRIIRWVREKLGMGSGGGSSVPRSLITTSSLAATNLESPTSPPSAPATDIKTFVTQKEPKSEVHFAATIAYFFQFVAPTGQRKDSIGKDDLVNACRQVDRKRLKHPAQVLVNAFHEGVLDRGETGQYRLNSVGENLVAMVLPGKPESSKTTRKKGKKKGGSRRKG